MRIFFLLTIIFHFPLFFLGQIKGSDILYENKINKHHPSRNNADSLPLHAEKNIDLSNLHLPKTERKEIVIHHTGFSLSYNEAHEQANWVAYELSEEKTKKVFGRTNKFMPDPLVKTKTANDKDYVRSGYDRGHLAPAADMGWSAATMAESFYFSNISPQVPAFNQGIWKHLEEQVRQWAVDNKVIYIVTGPVLSKNLPTIGSSKVSVPDFYYKVILDYSEPNIQAIGFIMKNAGSMESIKMFAVSVDSVEIFTGIDFFPALPDEQEDIIEGKLCVECWSWNEKKSGQTRRKKTKLKYVY
jgi:endonuclease G